MSYRGGESAEEIKEMIHNRCGVMSSMSFIGMWR